MRKAAVRTGLITLMLAGGLLSAGISQAQDVGAADAQERAAELSAAVGGPAPSDHLIAFTADRAAVEVRADDVADLPSSTEEPAPFASLQGGSTAKDAQSEASPLEPTSQKVATAGPARSR